LIGQDFCELTVPLLQVVAVRGEAGAAGEIEVMCFVFAFANLLFSGVAAKAPHCAGRGESGGAGLAARGRRSVCRSRQPAAQRPRYKGKQVSFFLPKQIQNMFRKIFPSDIFVFKAELEKLRDEKLRMLKVSLCFLFFNFLTLYSR
jgi:hypothetical protein